MGSLWLLFITFWRFLPWIAVAMMAGLSLHRRKDSYSLLLQAAGAGAMFLLGIVQWMFNWLFSSAPKILVGGEYVFGFLFFIALSAFALGYCIERFRRPAQSSPVQVSASPVDR
jgi:hypothetical protein